MLARRADQGAPLAPQNDQGIIVLVEDLIVTDFVRCDQIEILALELAARIGLDVMRLRSKADNEGSLLASGD